MLARASTSVQTLLNVYDLNSRSKGLGTLSIRHPTSNLNHQVIRKNVLRSPPSTPKPQFSIPRSKPIETIPRIVSKMPTSVLLSSVPMPLHLLTLWTISLSQHRNPSISTPSMREWGGMPTSLPGIVNPHQLVVRALCLSNVDDVLPFFVPAELVASEVDECHGHVE